MSGAKIWVTPEPLIAEDGSICTEETNTIGGSSLRSLFLELIMSKIGCDLGLWSLVSHINLSLSMMLMGRASDVDICCSQVHKCFIKG